MRLNRGIAVAELDGPEAALAEIESLPLEGYHAFPATHAHLLRRLGRNEESRAAYDRAIGVARNAAETAYLVVAATSWPASESPGHRQIGFEQTPFTSTQVSIRATRSRR